VAATRWAVAAVATKATKATPKAVVAEAATRPAAAVGLTLAEWLATHPPTMSPLVEWTLGWAVQPTDR
jgi:hypothetical protein